jgi:hypothetical protein
LKLPLEKDSKEYAERFESPTNRYGDRGTQSRKTL